MNTSTSVLQAEDGTTDSWVPASSPTASLCLPKCGEAPWGNYLHQALDRVHEAVVITNLQGVIVYANHAAVELYGWAVPDLIGRSILGATIPPITPEQGQDILRRLRAGETPQGEFCVVRADGTLLPVSVQDSPLLDSTGELAGVICISTDISERKDSEERYRMLFEGNPQPMWVFDRETFRFLAVNQAAIVRYGYSREELLSMRITDLAPPEDEPRIIEAVSREGFYHEAGVWRNRFKDGCIRSVEISSHAITFAGRPARTVLALDVTERLQAEERILEQAALLDKAREAIFVKDLDDTILYWNKGAERLYGWASEEVVGRSSLEVFNGDAAKVDAARAVLMQKNDWQGEMIARAKDGRELPVEVRWSLVRHPDGTPKSVLAIHIDLTEKKKLQAQFLRAQRLESIGTLAGGIAHDLNNVLAPILMSGEVLREYIPDEDGQSLLDTMLSSAQRGADLVKQVLAFARGVDGRRIPVNLKHLARDIQKIARDTFPRNIQFGIHSPRDLWAVTGDPTQLHQVLMNLCVNARDAMPFGGRLEVRLENVVLDDVYAGLTENSRPGSYVVMTVGDSGVGIASHIREKVFDPFFTTKEPGKGTGLGLATVAALVKEHGGFVNLYSEVGKGTRFKVYLPATDSSSAADWTPAEPAALPRGNGELVLLVDDEASVRAIGKRTLENYGYRVLVAANGAEAVSEYAQHRQEIAVVLTDMAMPVMDGAATVIALRSLNPGVRIVGSSGLTANEEMAKAMGAGLDFFVPKPYTAQLLLRTMRSALHTGNPDSLTNNN